MVVKSAIVTLVLLCVRFSPEKVGMARVPYCEKFSPSSRNSCPVATVGYILWSIETVESEEWNKRILTVTCNGPEKLARIIGQRLSFNEGQAACHRRKQLSCRPA
jgi:hypothetical protein